MGSEIQNQFYAGGFLYKSKTNDVLLHKRDAKAAINPGKWAFFGGLNEEDETPKQTFLREIREELGIAIPKESVNLLCDYFNEELQTCRHVFFVESDLEKSDMTLMEGEDFDWIALDKVFGYDLTEKTARDLKVFVSTRKNVRAYFTKWNFVRYQLIESKKRYHTTEK